MTRSKPCGRSMRRGSGRTRWLELTAWIAWGSDLRHRSGVKRVRRTSYELLAAESRRLTGDCVFVSTTRLAATALGSQVDIVSTPRTPRRTVAFAGREPRSAVE